ncbi:MAG: MurR/RpiR family transcriptional regulator [Trueperaceae bacterium]|nr:MurR/RpiR family transcriptional regulator [Trueperaceae bacterium]
MSGAQERLDAPVLRLLLEDMEPRFEQNPLRLESKAGIVPLVRPSVTLRELTAGQSAIADYIIVNTDDAPFMSAAEIGRKCGVSESTVVRFASAIGLSGYPQLQELLQARFRVQASIMSRMQVSAGDLGAGTDFVSRIANADLQNLQKTFANLDRAAFDAAISVLKSPRRLYSFGLRASSPLSSLFTIAMSYIGREVTQLSPGVGDVWDRMQFMSSNDAMLAMSFRRYKQESIDIIEHAYERGVKIVLITDSMVAPAAPFATVTLTVHRNIHSVIESSTAPTSLINALVTGIAMATKEDSLAALKNREALWASKQLYVHSQPRSDWGPELQEPEVDSMADD